MAAAKELKAQNINVLYVCFNDNQANDLVSELNIDHYNLVLQESVLTYLEMKIKSKSAASWISDSSFFKAIFNMLPSLGDMILLGQMIDLLENDPTLHLVVDSPSSGHALALFETTDLWFTIFKKGLLVDDIKRMQNFLNDENNLKVTIITLPTQMSLEESSELKQKLEQKNIKNLNLIINDAYSHNKELANEDLPHFLNEKVRIEKNLITQFTKDNPLPIVPHFLTDTMTETIISINKWMEASDAALL